MLAEEVEFPLGRERELAESGASVGSLRRQVAHDHPSSGPCTTASKHTPENDSSHQADTWTGMGNQGLDLWLATKDENKTVEGLVFNIGVGSTIP